MKNPISVALGAEATFVARTIDSDRKHLTAVLRSPAAHRGTAFVEIYQNCNIFNDDAFEPLKDIVTRDDFTIRLVHGEPITYGKDGEFGIARDRGTAALGTVNVAEVGLDGVLRHDAHSDDPSIAFALSRLADETLRRTPIGVFRQVERVTYDDLMTEQIEHSVTKHGPGELATLLAGGDTWTVD